LIAQIVAEPLRRQRLLLWRHFNNSLLPGLPNGCTQLNNSASTLLDH
jgi:hypothetical protein